MTPIAPHIAAFLRERLPLQRGASSHTTASYAYTFQLLFQFASDRFKVVPSQLERTRQRLRDGLQAAANRSVRSGD